MARVGHLDAIRSGQSLQAYVRRRLDEEAALLTPEEAADQARAIAERSAVTAGDVVDAVAEVRGLPRAEEARDDGTLARTAVGTAR